LFHNLFFFFCIYVFMLYHNKCLFPFLFANFVFLFLTFCDFWFLCSMFGFRLKFVFSLFVIIVLMLMTCKTFQFCHEFQLSISIASKPLSYNFFFHCHYTKEWCVIFFIVDINKLKILKNLVYGKCFDIKEMRLNICLYVD